MYTQQPPPYVPPVLTGASVATDADTASPRRRNRMLVTVGSVVTVGLVGLGAAAIAFGGGGAASPEEAVRHLATAIDGEDVLAAVATLAPDETRSLPELYRQATEKGKELELPDRMGDAVGVDQSGEAGADGESSDDRLFGDLDLKVTGLEVEVTELSGDIAKVEIVGGTLSWDFPDGADLFDPLSGLAPWGVGGFDDTCSLMDLPAEADDGADGGADGEMYDPCSSGADEVSEVEDRIRHGEVDLGELHREADDDQPGVFTMTVQRDGGWYVSPLFTAAEYARVMSGGDPLDSYTVDPGPAAGSPTDAVRALGAALTAGNADGVANVMASELSVWRVYSQAFEDDEFRNLLDDAAIKVSDLELREEPIDGERVRVVIEHAVIEGSEMVRDYDSVSDDDYEDPEFDEEDIPLVEETSVVTIDGDCVTMTRDGERSEERTCLDTAGDGMVKALGVNRIALVAVADRDGWAVSPIETLADYLRTVVDHLSMPLVNRFLGSTGLVGATSEPTATLHEGDNDVQLDSAGTAVVSADVDEGDLVTLTSDDDGVVIHQDAFSSIIVGPDPVVVTAPIGTRSANVSVKRVDVTDVSAATPDGAPTATITGRLEAGDVHAFRMTAADYRLMSSDVGYALTTEELDENGEWIYVDDGDIDDDDLVIVAITYDTETEFTDEGDDRYTISFAPASGGFAGPDPATLTVGLDDYFDAGEPLAVVEGRPVDLTIDATAGVTAVLSCDSGQFEDEQNADEDEYDYGYSYGRTIDVIPGTPSVTRLDPTETEVCTVSLSPDYSMLDEDSGDAAIDVTLRLTPAG